MGRDCRRSVSDLLEEARSPLGPDQVPPCWVLESSKDEGCTAPLGEVSHCWTVLLVEKNFPMSSLALSCFSWCCCLSHHALWQRVWLRFLNNLFIGMSWSLLGPPRCKAVSCPGQTSPSPSASHHGMHPPVPLGGLHRFLLQVFLVPGV